MNKKGILLVAIVCLCALLAYLITRPVNVVPFSNCTHPELRGGEVWITNSAKGGEEVGWKTKRVGQKAYDVYGNPIGLVPVFAQATELRKAGINPNKMCD